MFQTYKNSMERVTMCFDLLLQLLFRSVVLLIMSKFMLVVADQKCKPLSAVDINAKANLVTSNVFFNHGKRKIKNFLYKIFTCNCMRLLLM
jgi:hypothetical protein